MKKTVAQSSPTHSRNPQVATSTTPVSRKQQPQQQAKKDAMSPVVVVAGRASLIESTPVHFILRIQCCVRRYLARRELQRRQLQFVSQVVIRCLVMECIIKLQQWWRRRMHRLHCAAAQHLLRRRAAAILIEALWRGHWARTVLLRAKREAVSVQAIKKRRRSTLKFRTQSIDTSAMTPQQKMSSAALLQRVGRGFLDRRDAFTRNDERKRSADAMRNALRKKNVVVPIGYRAPESKDEFDRRLVNIKLKAISHIVLRIQRWWRTVSQQIQAKRATDRLTLLRELNSTAILIQRWWRLILSRGATVTVRSLPLPDWDECDDAAERIVNAQAQMALRSLQHKDLIVLWPKKTLRRHFQLSPEEEKKVAAARALRTSKAVALRHAHYLPPIRVGRYATAQQIAVEHRRPVWQDTTSIPLPHTSGGGGGGGSPRKKVGTKMEAAQQQKRKPASSQR